VGAPGCDDAPLIEVPLGNAPKAFTLILPYYENPAFLRQQLAYWNDFGPSMFEVIIVDDGSPEYPAEPIIRASKQAYLRHFRIDVDVRWNWLAARNIGAYHARTQWIMLTDMDHVLPATTLETLIFGQHDPEIIYRFSRTGAKTHPHPNSWFMTKAMFWKIGGYDERMSGYYGSDGYYRRRCADTAPIRIMTVPLELHEHEGDASTTRYKRKQIEDAKLRPLVRKFPKNSKPKVLSFPYHEIHL